MKQNRLLEIFLGISVLVVAIGFVSYTFINVIVSGLSSYTLHAKFYNIGSLAVGSNVMVNGVKIGSISGIDLSKDDYSVIVTMSVNSGVMLSKNSAVKIMASGFFDNSFLDVVPTLDKDFAKNGDLIAHSLDWQSIEDKISSMFLDQSK